MIDGMTMQEIKDKLKAVEKRERQLKRSNKKLDD